MSKSGLIIVLLIIALTACSTKTDQQAADNTDSQTATDTSISEQDAQIEAMINEAMMRLRYKDKTYLYELEFPYYREEQSFDEYLKTRVISTARADTLEFVDVKRVTYFGKDSAWVVVDVHFEGASGNKSVLENDSAVYYWYDGRWLKPTLSTLDGQRLYDKIRRQADSAAKAEARELGND